MRLTFPRDMTTMRRWKKPKLYLSHQQEVSRRAGGVSQVKDLGPSIWMAEYQTVPLRLEEADAVLADFNTLRDALFSFYLHPADRPLPAAHVNDGLGAAGGVVDGISVDRDAVRLGGVETGFGVKAGDYFSISTSTGIEFIQARNDAPYLSGGRTLIVDVTPYVRSSVRVNDPVTLVNPLVEMRLEPGSLKSTYDGLSHRSISFKAAQVIR